MPPASLAYRAHDKGCGLCASPDAKGHPHRVEVLRRQRPVESQLEGQECREGKCGQVQRMYLNPAPDTLSLMPSSSQCFRSHNFLLILNHREALQAEDRKKDGEI